MKDGNGADGLSAEASPFVVAISGPPGSGKTTLCRRVSALLGDAVPLHFDDYDPDDVADVGKSRYPSDWNAWRERGFDLAEIEFPARLTSDLAALKRGEAIANPRGKGLLGPAAYVVLEEPYGRERPEMAPYIDLVAAIDLPFDVGLARLLLRNAQVLHQDHFGPRNAPCAKPPEKFGSSLYDYLQGTLTHYLTGGRREGHQELRRRLLANCDLALDGLAPPEDLALEIAESIRQRQSNETEC